MPLSALTASQKGGKAGHHQKLGLQTAHVHDYAGQVAEAAHSLPNPL